VWEIGGKYALGVERERFGGPRVGKVEVGRRRRRRKSEQVLCRCRGKSSRTDWAGWQGIKMYCMYLMLSGLGSHTAI
jgi:hypothetical protein